MTNDIKSALKAIQNAVGKEVELYGQGEHINYVRVPVEDIGLIRAALTQAKEIAELKVERDTAIDLLSRHYGGIKVCQHDFNCVCLQDETKAFLAKHTKEGE